MNRPAGSAPAKQAIQYLCVLNETLGSAWLTPDLFRFGASSLLNDVLMQIHKQRTGRIGPATTSRSIDRRGEFNRYPCHALRRLSGKTSPSPEARDIVSLEERYGLYISSEQFAPRSRQVVRDHLARRPRSISPRWRLPAPATSTSPCRRRAAPSRAAGRHCARPTGQVTVQDRAPDPGALARARSRGVAQRRQADKEVARRRLPARGGAFLLLRGLGRQARVRLPEPPPASARRRRPDHPVELPAADAVAGRSRPHSPAATRSS